MKRNKNLRILINSDQELEDVSSELKRIGYMLGYITKKPATCIFTHDDVGDETFEVLHYQEPERVLVHTHKTVTLEDLRQMPTDLICPFRVIGQGVLEGIEFQPMLESELSYKPDEVVVKVNGEVLGSEE